MTTDEFSKILDEKLQPWTAQFEGLNGRMEALEESIEGVSLHRIVQLQKDQKKIEKRLSTISGKLSKMATKHDVSSAKEDLKHDILKFKSDILGELQNIRDDMDLMSGYRDKLADHEERIERPEKVANP